jgi:hypothetical protein
MAAERKTESTRRCQSVRSRNLESVARTKVAGGRARLLPTHAPATVARAIRKKRTSSLWGFKP